MNRISVFMSGMLLLLRYAAMAQPISGVVNNYAAVTNISGTGITVASTAMAAPFLPGDRALLIQMKGASVNQTNQAGFGDIVSMGGAGTYEFLNVSSASGSVVTVSSALTRTYNVSSGWVQLVRVPRFCSPVVSNTLSCASWTSTTKTGGVLAFEAGTLTLNADIDVSEKGFKGGSFTAGTFSCTVGTFGGASGVYGGQKGESISEYVPGLNGFKGHQANGGGASNAGNSGGGGGGNAGEGGFGGNQYSGCDTIYDERGIGGASLTPVLSSMWLGGGGGGGFRDNGLTASSGGNGGGIIYIRANAIIANGHMISSNGGNVTIMADGEGSGGGGAGGTVFLECNNISGNLSVNTKGGFGGSNNNSMFVSFCHGPGGGGGGGLFAFSGASLPGNVTYNTQGGLPGVINNTSSACYNTSFGATAGASGTLIAGLPASAQILNAAPALVITPSTTICRGEAVTLFANNGQAYYWSNGSNDSTIVVTPSVSTSYTVVSTHGNVNSCQASASTNIIVSLCTGIASLHIQGAQFSMYPNPAGNQLFVETPAAMRLIIYDGLGKTVMDRPLSEGVNTLDLSDLKPGVYLVTDAAHTQVMKLIRAD